MPILEEPSQENLDVNWVRTILQEKERQLNNNSGCDVHEKCISTQKIKVSVIFKYIYLELNISFKIQ